MFYLFATKKEKTSGFAMLFTVLIMSLILTIAIGISNITFKQTILSSLAKDSQVAFYQADKGIECGMYYDLPPVEYFPLGVGLARVPREIDCGENTLYLSDESYDDYFVYYEKLDGSLPCTKVYFDKTDSSINKVRAQGFNICGEGPRKVERQLEVQY